MSRALTRIIIMMKYLSFSDAKNRCQLPVLGILEVLGNLYLFTGENAFLLREERRRWIGEFTRKYGEENVSRVDGAKVTVRDLLDEVGVMPFLAEKRLVVVEGVPKATKEEIQALDGQIHPQVLLLMVDPKPDKRTSGVKELLNVAEVKEFAPLKGVQLKPWMHTYAQSHGGSFTPGGADALLEFLGDDQDQIAQEIGKLALAAGGRPITPQDVDLQVIPTDEGVIWKISDLLAAGRRPDALAFARRLLDRGGDAYGLWAILLNMLKNLTAVHAAMAAGHRTSKDLAEETGVHVFAVRTLQSHAQRVKEPQLASFLTWAAAADRDLKTGGFRTTDGEQQELLALIDRFILACP